MVALRSPSSRSVRLGCSPYEPALHRRARRRTPGPRCRGRCRRRRWRPPAGRTPSRPARPRRGRGRCPPSASRNPDTAWSTSREQALLRAALVGVGVEAAEAHRVDPGRRARLDAARDQSSWARELRPGFARRSRAPVGVVERPCRTCPTVRCRSAIDARPRRPAAAARPRHGCRAPANAVASGPLGSGEPAQRQRGARRGRRPPAAAAAPAPATRRAAGRAPVASEPAADQPVRRRVAGRGGLPDVHRAEVAAVGLRVADAADDRQRAVVPQLLEARQARVEAEAVAEVEHLALAVGEVRPRAAGRPRRRGMTVLSPSLPP